MGYGGSSAFFIPFILTNRTTATGTLTMGVYQPVNQSINQLAQTQQATALKRGLLTERLDTIRGKKTPACSARSFIHC